MKSATIYRSAIAGAIFVLSPLAAAADGSNMPGVVFRDCSDICPEMVVLRHGSFEMGLGEEESRRKDLAPVERVSQSPRHLVKIGRGFALGKYDVTRAEFSVFVRDAKYQPDQACDSIDGTQKLSWRSPGFPQTDRDPVVCVSWVDAHAYVAWLSRKTHHRYRLPSEAEWEYAARAGTLGAVYWTGEPNQTCKYANVYDIAGAENRGKLPNEANRFDCNDHYKNTAPSGSFLPNGFGLYDMLGNVSQLTEDCWHLTYLAAPPDGSAWLDIDCNNRMQRGASFRAHPRFVHLSERQFIPTDIQSPDTGFRVARSIRD